MVKYKSYLIGVQGYKGRAKIHGSLRAAKQFILRNIRPGTHRPAWIYRIENGKEKLLPGQYEVRTDGDGRIALYNRSRTHQLRKVST